MRCLHSGTTLGNQTETSILCSCPNGMVIRLMERHQKPQAKNLGSLLYVRDAGSENHLCLMSWGAGWNSSRGAVFLGSRPWEDPLQVTSPYELIGLKGARSRSLCHSREGFTPSWTCPTVLEAVTDTCLSTENLSLFGELAAGLSRLKSRHSELISQAYHPPSRPGL